MSNSMKAMTIKIGVSKPTTRLAQNLLEIVWAENLEKLGKNFIKSRPKISSDEKVIAL